MTRLDVLIDCVLSVRDGNEKSYQLLRDSLDLYLTINPDNVQYLLLQARLYFHLGIWPEKVGTRTNIFAGKLTADSMQTFDASLFVVGRRFWTSCSTFRRWTRPSTGLWATWSSTHWNTSSTRNTRRHPRRRGAALRSTWRSSMQSVSS